MDQIRVLAFSGSLKQPSHTRSLVYHVAALLRERGVIVDEWDIRDPLLPYADPYVRDATKYEDPHARRLGELARSADASIWASPIYHNSYTGALKNALDILHDGFFDHKVIGLMSHGGNRATQAVDHLRIVARSVQGLVIPTQVCTINDDYVEDDDAIGGFRIASEMIEARIDRFVHEFIELTEATRAMRP